MNDDTKHRFKEFVKSYTTFQQIISYISSSKKDNFGYELLATQLNTFFKVEECGIRNLINILNSTSPVLKTYMALPKAHRLSNIKIYKRFHKEYNQQITHFRSYLKENTILNAITTVNKYCVLCPPPYIILTDILTLEEFKSNEKHLKFDDEHVTQFVNDTYFLNCLKTYIDECKIDDVKIVNSWGYNRTVTFDLKINFKHSNSNKISHINSHDAKIPKLFENSRGYVSDQYNQFQRHVKQKCCFLIKSQWNNPDYNYRYITCIKCNASQIITHVNNNNNKLYECANCRFNMCGHGCGMYYHGNTNCGEDVKDATETIIKLFINSQCPKCKQYLEKITGCNHMSCRCGTHYCNKCGNEYEKDRYGHYMITEHHRTRCDQYEKSTKIVMPSINEIKQIFNPEKNNGHSKKVIVNNNTLKIEPKIRSNNYSYFWCFVVLVQVYILFYLLY